MTSGWFSWKLLRCPRKYIPLICLRGSFPNFVKIFANIAGEDDTRTSWPQKLQFLAEREMSNDYSAKTVILICEKFFSAPSPITRLLNFGFEFVGSFCDCSQQQTNYHTSDKRISSMHYCLHHWKYGYSVRISARIIMCYYLVDLLQWDESILLWELVSELFSFSRCFKFTRCIFRYLCISSVYRLCAECSSLTVTLVITLRKFVSLIFSILYFKNPFTIYHWVGTSLVFAGTVIFTELPQKMGLVAEHKVAKTSKKTD